MSFRTLSVSLCLILVGAAAGTAFGAGDNNTTSASVNNPNGCKVVERKANDNPSGTLSSSVTAGNGQVSGSTTGGNGVTVHSGNGTSSSMVTTTGSGSGQTTVTTSDGNCIIYVNPGEKKDH